MAGAITGIPQIAGSGAAIGSGDPKLEEVVRAPQTRAVADRAAKTAAQTVDVGAALKMHGIGGSFDAFSSYVPYIVPASIAVYSAADALYKIL